MYWLTWEKFLLILFFAVVLVIFYYRKYIFTPLYLEYMKLEAECHYLLFEPILRKLHFYVSYRKDLSKFNSISRGLCKSGGKIFCWSTVLGGLRSFTKNLLIFYQHPVSRLGDFSMFLKNKKRWVRK